MALKCQEFNWNIHNFSTNIAKFMESNKYLRTPDFSISIGKIQTEWCIFLNFNRTGIDLYCNKNSSGYQDIKVKFDIEIPTSKNDFVIKRDEEKSYAELENGLRWTQLISSGLINGDFFQTLPNDTLEIKFRMQLFWQKMMQINPLDHILGDMCLFDQIKTCFETKEYADFVFICSDGENIPAHRLICSAYSPVMKTMFETKMQEAVEGVVKVTDIDSKTMTEVLRFMYTKKVCCLDVLATKILYAAEKYGLIELKYMCLARMIESLSVENALEYFFLADRYNNPELLQSSITFIKLNYNILREVAKDWNNLNNKQWVMLLDHFNEQVVKQVLVYESSM